MTKEQMARAIAKVAAKNDRQEMDRIFEWQMSRTQKQVQESFDRQGAYMSTTQAEINRHCQFGGLPLMTGKKS